MGEAVDFDHEAGFGPGEVDGVATDHLLGAGARQGMAPAECEQAALEGRAVGLEPGVEHPAGVEVELLGAADCPFGGTTE